MRSGRTQATDAPWAPYRTGGALAALILALLAVTPAPAGDQTPLHPFWVNRDRTAAAISAQLATQQDPLVRAALATHAHREMVWPEPPAKRAPAIAPELLQGVRDDTRFPRLAPRTPEEALKGMKGHPGYTEYLAYSRAFVLAARTPPEAFAASARDNAQLTYSHLFNEPARRRGEVVRMEGRLFALLEREAPIPAALEGVPKFYEGWVLLDRPGVPPVCVVVTELPEGLEPSEKLDRPVSFEGYFFKRYLVEGADGKDRKTLLFVAPTLHLGEPPPPRPAAPTLSGTLLYLLLGAAVVTVALIFGAGWLYRRGDRRVRARLLDLQANQFLAREEALDALAERPPEPETPPTPGSNGAPTER